MVQNTSNQRLSSFTSPDGQKVTYRAVSFGTKPLQPMSHSQKLKIAKRFQKLKADKTREARS